MNRIFTDTFGNVIPDVEYRLNPTAVIRVLLENGTLTTEDVAAASDGRIIEVHPNGEQVRTITPELAEAILDADESVTTSPDADDGEGA